MNDAAGGHTRNTGGASLSKERHLCLLGRDVHPAFLWHRYSAISRYRKTGQTMAFGNRRDRNLSISGQ